MNFQFEEGVKYLRMHIAQWKEVAEKEKKEEESMAMQGFAAFSKRRRQEKTKGQVFIFIIINSIGYGK